VCVCVRERERERETVCARVYFPARRILVFSWRETREEKKYCFEKFSFSFHSSSTFFKIG